MTHPNRTSVRPIYPAVTESRGCTNQTTSRLPQGRRRCIQAGHRNAGPSDACHTDSLRRSAGGASSGRPGSAPQCGDAADQVSGALPHHRGPKGARSSTLDVAQFMGWLSTSAGCVEWPAWLSLGTKTCDSVRAKRQAIHRTRHWQGALSSCSADGDLPSVARGPSIGPARDIYCHCGRGAAVGRGCPRVADVPAHCTCVWGRCLVWIELPTVCHNTCLPRFSCTM